ncbi:MAG: rhodanese-like domain-containing protein [Bdellovibrionales bacterium]|nr:rhodanese-like domain-containing protein [Bdellovibrionales bacterium]
MKKIEALDLKEMMKQQDPNYSSRSVGYIVVNTLPQNSFQKEHIPRSINVTKDDMESLKRFFDQDKLIITYCASESCDSSLKGAQELEKLGFTNVTDFEGGLAAWKDANGEVKSGAAQPSIETDPSGV